MMSLTISTSRSVFQQSLNQPLPKSDPAQNPPSSSATSVTLSDEAQTLLQQEKSIQKMPLSKADLQAIYHRSNGPNSWLFKLTGQMNTHGEDAPALKDLPRSTDLERLAQAKKAADFVYAHHIKASLDGSPYKGLSREALSEIVYDESGDHTDAERRAAFLTRHHNDETFKAKLNAQPDQRVIFQGSIDYFDSLSPVEQSIYPDGHRETRLRLLEEEEAQSGKLPASINILELMMSQSPSRQWDLQSYQINEYPAVEVFDANKTTVDLPPSTLPAEQPKA